MATHMTQKTWTTSKDESREIMALWPDLVRDITSADYYLDVPPEVPKWMAKVILELLMITDVFSKITFKYSSGILFLPRYCSITFPREGKGEH